MDVRTKALRSILWSVNKSAKTAKATAQMGRCSLCRGQGRDCNERAQVQGLHTARQASPRQVGGVEGTVALSASVCDNR